MRTGDTDNTAAFNPPPQRDAFNIDGFSDLGLYNRQGTAMPPPAAAMCGAPATRLANVQGTGTTPPLAGLNVGIEAVAAAGYSGATGFNGFFT